MPSGVSNDVANALLDRLAGPAADVSLLGDTMWLHAYTTGPTDDDGTGRVDWGQGAVSVDVTDGTNWPDAADRAKTSAMFTIGTNSSGATVTVVALGWETAESGGAYLGGGPVAGGGDDVADGATYTAIASLTAPSPS